jgi:hypothetical protein
MRMSGRYSPFNTHLQIWILKTTSCLEIILEMLFGIRSSVFGHPFTSWIKFAE